MVRHYVRKSNRGKGSTKEILLKAVEEVKLNKLALTEAANRYNIPRPTLVDRIRGKRGLKLNTYGRTPVLRAIVEKAMLLKVMEKYGYGLSLKNTLPLVADYIKGNRIPSPFCNGVPGEKWWLSFKQRHNLSLKKPQLVEVARKKICASFIINGYFDLLENTEKMNFNLKRSLITFGTWTKPLSAATLPKQKPLVQKVFLLHAQTLEKAKTKTRQQCY